jgi:quercetin dioxygenase-like cupin family protein
LFPLKKLLGIPHVQFALPKKIVWREVGPGEYQAKLFGDETKPGIYGVLVKWTPGHFSRPHTDSEQRYFCVVSGTWWVSSSNTYDLTKTYPLPAGASGAESANTIHWDGAKAQTGPVIVEIIGTGPVGITQRTPEAALDAVK